MEFNVIFLNNLRLIALDRLTINNQSYLDNKISFHEYRKRHDAIINDLDVIHNEIERKLQSGGYTQ